MGDTMILYEVIARLVHVPHLLYTIAGDGEGCNVSSMMCNKDPDQCDIEDHALHQHPHEGDQEPVVEKNSN